jgi:uncharacterized Zn finger protein
MGGMAIIVAFTEDDLRALAGPRSFERAWDYLDAVDDLDLSADAITATVYGGAGYDVTLTMDSGAGLSGKCACPYGVEGNFCKHCVAVGLVVLDRDDQPPTVRADTAGRREHLTSWLESLSREGLLDLLREQLAGDKDLRRRLEVRAAADQAVTGADVGAVRERIADLFNTDGFGRYGYVEYRDAYTYASQAGEAVAAIRSLTAAGHASQAALLAREAIRLLADAYDQVDDSSGAVGGVAADLEEAHREACGASGVDPLETAEWLAGHMLGAWSYLPDVEFDDYRDLLGEAGRARFRNLVAEAWRRNPSGWAEKYLIQRMIKDEGDVDALVAVLAADLAPHGATHLTIAHELDEAGRSAKALEWAERGLRDTAGDPYIDYRLVDYVTGRCEQSGRLADAVTVRRDHFRAARTLDTYQKLRATAQSAGCWEAERAPALDRLRADARDGRDRCGYDGLMLIDALIDDGDIDSAWREAEGRANQRQWLALADLIQNARPADALHVYRQAIEPLKRVTGDGNYREMARLLLRARACHHSLGTDTEFAAYLAALRTDQRRKRNLIKILDQQGL